MVNSVNVQNAGFYPGCTPVMIENHSNPEAETFREKVLDEIKTKQAYVKVEFLQNTLEKYKNELTKPQQNVLNAELDNAQRELALLRQQLNAKYGVVN